MDFIRRLDDLTYTEILMYTECPPLTLQSHLNIIRYLTLIRITFISLIIGPSRKRVLLCHIHPDPDPDP